MSVNGTKGQGGAKTNVWSHMRTSTYPAGSEIGLP